MAQRYQREIEEILDKVNEDAPVESRAKRGSRPGSAPSKRRPEPNRRPRVTFDFSPGRLLVIGVLLLAGALVLKLIGVGFAAPFAWVGIALFVVAYILFFTKPRRTVERRWRGQSIEDLPAPSQLGRFFRWISGG